MIGADGLMALMPSEIFDVCENAWVTLPAIAEAYAMERNTERNRVQNVAGVPYVGWIGHEWAHAYTVQ